MVIWGYRVKKAVSLTLAVVLVLTTTHIEGYASGREDSSESGESSYYSYTQDDEESLLVQEKAEAEIICELPEERSEYSKEYLLSDSSREIVIYDEAVHYEDENGDLVEIDNSLIKTEDGYTNAGNSFSVLIRDDVSKGEVVFSDEDYEISFMLTDTVVENESITAEVTDIDRDSDGDEDIFETKQSSVTFGGFSSGISVEYMPTSDGVKENIVLSDKSCGNSFSFAMDAQNLEVELSSSNEINFIDPMSGEVLYYFPAPFMYDSEGNISYDVRYSISSIRENEEITDEEHRINPGNNKASQEEMSESDSKYSDVSFNDVSGSDVSSNEGEVTEPEYDDISTNDEDYQEEEYENNIYSGNIYLELILDREFLDNAHYPVTVDPVLKQNKAKNLCDMGSVSSDGKTYEALYAGVYKKKVYRSFLMFELPDIPKEAVITEAKLYLNGAQNEEDTHYLTVHEVFDSWKNKNAEGYGRDLSFNDLPSFGPALDYTTNAGSFNITKAVRNWKSGNDENFGLMIKAYDEAANKRETLKLKTGTYLKLTYRTVEGVENYYGTHETSAGTAGVGYINDYMGYLTVINGDIETSGERFPMAISHIYNSNISDTDADRYGKNWRLNLEETVRPAVETGNLGTYPYVYTDADGSRHYFVKKSVTYLENGVSKTVSDSVGGYAPAADEDGLGLYIVPVQDKELKKKYPIKLIDLSESTVKYFDSMGRLCLITDSNQYENGKNSSTKEINSISIEYEDIFPGDIESDSEIGDISDAITRVKDYQTYLKSGSSKVSDVTSGEYLSGIKNDILRISLGAYSQKNVYCGTRVISALNSLCAVTDALSLPSKADTKSYISKVLSSLQELEKKAEELCAGKEKRIKSVTDAVGNKANFSYDGEGRLSSISDPASREKNENRYLYDEKGNLVHVLFSNGDSAYYSYVGSLLTDMSDKDGYTISYKYSAENRVTFVSESVRGSKGQSYSIDYSNDGTTTYRFSGTDDIYGTDDDIENIYSFDEYGKTVCVYSRLTGSNEIIGASMASYNDETEDASRNKIKDSATIGRSSENYLKNHSFEYDDSGEERCWGFYNSIIYKGQVHADGDSYGDVGTGADNYTGESKAASGSKTKTDTGFSYSTKKKYLGAKSAYIDLTKKIQGEAYLEQPVDLEPGTYTFSGYVYVSDKVADCSSYLKAVIPGEGKIYSEKVTGPTDPLFDNGWERLWLTFTLTEPETIKVSFAVNADKSDNKGYVCFDCLQMEKGDVPGDYNIFEDGSFEDSTDGTPYKWTVKKSSDKSFIGNEVVKEGIVGENCYHISGQPGKTKYLRVTTNLGGKKNGYVLSGWVKAENMSPSNGSERKLEAEVYYSYKDEEENTITYTVKYDFNVFLSGWNYFSFAIPAKAWGSTRITFTDKGCLGDFYLDGLSLSRNDVQTRKYDSKGKLISSYTELKEKTSKSDDYGRTTKETFPSGESISYSYSKNNEISSAKSSLGVKTEYIYDKYGNETGASSYKPAEDETTKPVYMYSSNEYTENGNLLSASTDNMGNKTLYVYDEYTGNLLETTLPARDIPDANGETSSKEVSTYYGYDADERLVMVEQEDRKVEYGYGEFDDLTTITHNGFDYEFVYDEFGNVIENRIAGNVVSTYEYGPNNGSLKKTTASNGSVITEEYNEYGQIVSEFINGEEIYSYKYDNNGNIYSRTDARTGVTERYRYNRSGMVVRTEACDLESGEPISRMQYTYTQGGLIGTLSYQIGNGETETYTYTYAKDELPTKSILPDGSYVTVNYDDLRRNSSSVYYPTSSATKSKRMTTAKKYATASVDYNGKTRKGETALVSEYTNKFSSTVADRFTYTYDSWGNISTISDIGSAVKTYFYDEYNEIVKAEETYSNGQKAVYIYEYDEGGNILSERVEEDGEALEHVYEYDDIWKDKLISYDGREIEYDASGCPVNYMGAKMEWDEAGRLISISGSDISTLKVGNDDSITYSYLSSGQRLSKSVNGITTEYIYNNGLLLAEKTEDETIYYYYDSNGEVVSIGYQKGTDKETRYFFSRNAQGDVIGIYRNSDSKLIGTYEYDLWGALVSVKEASAGIDTDGILQKNPIRYRSYYYDNETGLYYLNARYYDPQIRRFISADSLIAQPGTSITANNLFSYCLNNPVNRFDNNGNWSMSNWEKIAIGTVAAIGGIAICALTGGAAAPLLIGMAASVAVGGIGGYITGGKENIVNGMVDGFLIGGLGVFAGAAVEIASFSNITNSTEKIAEYAKYSVTKISKEVNKQTQDQKALLDIARECKINASNGNPISYEEAKILDEWAEEYRVSQHHQSYIGSGAHFRGGNYGDHTHIYNIHVIFRSTK